MFLSGLSAVFFGALFELISIPLRWLMGEAVYAFLNAILP